MLGRVKWLMHKRGTGFMKGKWRRVFVHYSAIQGKGLKFGGRTAVEFEIIQAIVDPRQATSSK